MRKLMKQFFELESSSGIILFMMAIVAVIWANSPLDYLHEEFINASLFFINEGLMAIFFLLVGLELKRGFLEGQLSSLRQVALPAIGALGGMLIPALVYSGVNHGDSITMRGWATPVATDIAFALGVLSLFGRRVPYGLKMFLLALAIFDDLGAILIIALFYSHGLSYLLLLQSFVLVLLLFILNRQNVKSLIPYLFVGVLLWGSLLYSGINPTIAGVFVALYIPDGRDVPEASPLHYLERSLHPWVAYLIMPLFALANAGVSFRSDMPLYPWDSKIVFGIVLGLFIGKQVGVFGFTWALIKLGFSKLPEKTGWLEVYGISLLCGIGFTMSLFLGTLSFQSHSIHLSEVRYGVLLGSALSGLVGAIVLSIAFTRK